jgi:uncharacterized membrane protein YgaE (UPF0421/DUF939 family)
MEFFVLSVNLILTKYKYQVYNYFRRLQMHQIAERMELEKQRLEQVYAEVEMLRTVRECAAQTHISMRRRIARFLRQIARNLDRADLKLKRV